MPNRLNNAVLALILLALPAPTAVAQSSAGFPYSIITPDPAERRAIKRARKAPPPQKAQPDATPKAVPQTKQAVRPAPRRFRGSSTASTIPTYRSPLTPLGRAPTIGTAPSMANPASPPTVVPGVSGTGGTPAVAPGRPAGQGFQDRASNCIASGTAQGVGPGQIGSFTQSCVNR